MAFALEALSKTRSRLQKEAILVNMFRSMLSLRASPDDVAAACYLCSPEKDSQSGGHRLRPDYDPSGDTSLGVW